MSLIALVERSVETCRRRAVLVLISSFVATLAMGYFVATHIKINTDVNQLLSADLPWRQREVEIEKAFPQKVDRLAIVIDAATPDAAENAAAELASKMEALPDYFRTVTRPDAIPFFRKNGLLYLDMPELGDMLNKMVQAQPLLGTLASDPSLRGLFGAMGLVLQGLSQGEVQYEQLDKPFDKMAEAVEGALQGKDAPLAWQSLVSSGEPKLRDIRKVILTQPVLDYADLEPGSKASQKVRDLAKDLNLTSANGISVRLTGSVALNDEEFSSVAEGAGLTTSVSVGAVLLILFLALRSFRLILPILLTLFVGLVATTAFAMASVGSLNLISVAFAVMFVGIAVDFGIQFGVRYRDQRHLEPDPAKAMSATARIIAAPLALAAGSTALGFLAFIPTAYRGVSELGLIAGAGMLIAFFLNITLLPALLSLFKSPAEPEAVGFAWAAPIDAFLTRFRKPLLGILGGVALVSLLLASQTRFDVDPLNLKNPKSESLSTLFDLMKDPMATPYTIEILRPTLAEAQSLADEIKKLPEAGLVMTLNSFLPEDEETKVGLIADANMMLAPTLEPPSVEAAPTDEETIAALQKAADGLKALGEDKKGAAHLAGALEAVVKANDPALLMRMQKVFISGMVHYLGMVKDLLSAESVSIATMTDDLKGDWVTADGRAKIEVYPKGNARDPKVLEAFTEAVQKLAPDASGPAISIQESGATIVRAFIEAGILAVLAISLLSWLILRRAGDVVRLILPLILAGSLTLATMFLIGLPLNFANIIALPLLLSLGVSYAIYFITYWRSGQTKPLQSSMARAVLFSAFTTLSAFGSLALSSHVGTKGMGELLTIALLYSLLCTFFVLPVLLGEKQLSN